MQLAHVEEVAAVVVATEGKVLRVCIVVKQSSPEIRRRVFERERVVIEDFPEYEFEFDIVTLRDLDIRSLADDPNLELAFVRK